ncbi:Hypothetical protein CINCED_3A023451 [Cinara cedri]|uniref:Uncharacterized protein n=1 Tax=Cinara cedri TaxID=506608 RepID=A0A5E4MD56_9HEMI|nr:Hypothetical protein CINCED_3A023451 [Cinara cedri]
MAYRITKCKKPHTIAEELILPAAVDMVNMKEMRVAVSTLIPRFEKLYSDLQAHPSH